MITQTIDSLVKKFSGRVADSSFAETFDKVECNYTLNELNIPTEDEVIDFLKITQGNDTIRVLINIQGWGGINFFGTINNSKEFLEDIHEKISQIEEGDIISLKVIIDKKILNGELGIYSLLLFSNYLESLSFEQLLKTFSNISKGSGINFKSAEVTDSVTTTLFNFISAGSADTFLPDLVFRQKRIEKVQGNVYTSQLSSFQLLADDFIFSSSENSLIKVEALFRKIAFGLFIVSIFDITSIDGDFLTFKLNGYKAINGKIDFSLVQFDSYYDEYHLIYNWVYDSNNINDRLGLARNIISLHLEKPGEIGLKGKVFQSVLSSYKVYEKQNVKQYIEIRNKISDQLLDFNKRATQIVDSFASGFQKSSITILTLFSSILGIKLLSNSVVTYLFTFYSATLSLVFITISIAYLFISMWEVREQRKRFIKSYENLKDRYTDLLEEDDIKRILNDDAEFKEDILFINAKLKSYTFLWILVLSLIFISTILFYYMSVKHLSVEMFIQNITDLWG